MGTRARVQLLMPYTAISTAATLMALAVGLGRTGGHLKLAKHSKERGVRTHKCSRRVVINHRR